MSDPSNTRSLGNRDVSPEAIHLLDSGADDANANQLPSVQNFGEKTSPVPQPYVIDVDEAPIGGDEITLLYRKQATVLPRDFGAEVRGSRDVETLRDALLMLNVHGSGLQSITEKLLHNVKQHMQDDEFSTEEAMQAIFTERNGCLIAETLQGLMSSSEIRGVVFDESWICIMCSLPRLTSRHVVLARLRSPINLGPSCQEASFIILVLAPSKEKTTKSALEVGRTFATLFMDMEVRNDLLEAEREEEVKDVLITRMRHLREKQGRLENRPSFQGQTTSVFDDPEGAKRRCPVGSGLLGDLKRRLPHYWSDYKDGVVGHKTPHKVIAAIFFLYFACVLPNLAFGMLNSNNTHGVIGIKKVLFSQCFGGLIFAVLGGQPLIVLLTTAPLALYTKVIYNISNDFDIQFDAMYACVGLWNSFFLLLYAVFNVSKLMKWSSRSTEEIFALFITFAFSADAIRDVMKDFDSNYHTTACQNTSSTNLSSNGTLALGESQELANSTDPVHECLRENSLLFLLLMLGTVWIGLTLFNFTQTPFLNAGKREILADYALPLAVLIMSFFGSFVFRDVKLKPFAYNPDEAMFLLAPLQSLSVGAIFASAGLGFSLSLLFFIDQNVSSALVNTPNNKLKKGAAYHWDLLVVAVINCVLSLFTFPWVHAALPHSPLHVRALADVEEQVTQGHVHQTVVRVRETRLTGIVSHVMIGLSMLLLPYPMSYIPRAVLDGLFLYVAITALYGNQFFDRILLLFTEQSAYPPNHYIRRVPQRKIHTFTCLQLLQLLVLCIFGFSPLPYTKMIFPVLLMFLMPIRHKIVPKLIDPRYLRALDGH